MKTKLYRSLLTSFLFLVSTETEAAGFTKLVIDDPGHRPMHVGLWYPTTAPVAAVPNTEYGLAVAMDAPIAKTNGGLILMSHGFGGWYAGHADTAIALADAGFVVAAPSHTGNTWSDMSATIDQWILDRPRHISSVIDHVFRDEGLMAHVDPAKIGVYGFSAGGYTALALIGGVPDLDRAADHCDAFPEEFACAERMVDALREAGLATLPRSAWGRDPRIKAASIAAPGLGFAFTQQVTC